MPRLSRKQLHPETLGEYINNLWSAFTVMDSKDDMRLLFKDLFTPTEFRMLAKRLEVARRLLIGEKYELIQKRMNVTPGTIAKINNILLEKGDGYRKAWDELNNLYGEKVNAIGAYPQTFTKSTLGMKLTKAGLIALDRHLSKKSKRNSAIRKLPT